MFRLLLGPKIFNRRSKIEPNGMGIQKRKPMA
jgi:hypothetical protein